MPILLYDPVKRVVGLAHAGWLGTVNGIVRETIEAMQTIYRSMSADILAAIGPSIAAHHYEVGPEVVQMVEKSFTSTASEFLVRDGEQDKAKFDLWRANQFQLENLGVKHVETAGICTACNLDDWYSHRAEKGETGRFGALIALKE
ncbi:unnamed protein product [marine sediment metagenome]|uniref:Purine nucleoside phosphorylase n=1 Tax=marine sediment metagenome TaxID=412755 RepID=X1DX17_9ZZZZ